MRRYQYKAINQNNQRFEGIVEAKDKDQAVEILREKQLLVINLRDIQSSLLYQFSIKLTRVSANDLMYFTRQLATMLKAGLPILNCLQLISRKAKPAMKKLIDQMILAVEGGDSLYKAMALHQDVFSSVYLALVRAGEVGGVLADVLERLAKNLERQRQFRAKVKAAMLYPAVVMLAMVGVGFVMMFVVVPKMAEIYESFDAELPLTTKMIIGTSAWMRNYWYFLVLTIIGAGYGGFTWLHTKMGKEQFDRFVLRLPYLGELIHKVISTEVTRTMSILVKAGVSIVETMQIVAKVSGNTVYQYGVERAALSVEKGVPLAASFSSENFFPESVTQMIAIGEETGKLDDMLARISRQFEQDASIALKALTSVIEPAMIIVLGVGVGFMVLSIIVPIYNLTSSF